MGSIYGERDGEDSGLGLELEWEYYFSVSMALTSVRGDVFVDNVLKLQPGLVASRAQN
jgi:hypothetical protein